MYVGHLTQLSKPFPPGLFCDSKCVQINLCPDKQNRYDGLMARLFLLDPRDSSPTSGSIINLMNALEHFCLFFMKLNFLINHFIENQPCKALYKSLAMLVATQTM